MDIIAFLKVTEIVISILLMFVILIQNKNAWLNLSTMSSSAWAITKRWPEKVLHYTTIILGSLFVANSLILSILIK
jgi:protein translocase SecG subunit